MGALNTLVVAGGGGGEYAYSPMTQMCSLVIWGLCDAMRHRLTWEGGSAPTAYLDGLPSLVPQGRLNKAWIAGYPVPPMTVPIQFGPRIGIFLFVGPGYLATRGSPHSTFIADLPSL